MTPYSSKSGKISGVNSFEIGDDFIVVRFRNTRYKYSNNSCGTTTIETMKELALASNGLSTFISQNNPAFEWKKR